MFARETPGKANELNELVGEIDHSCHGSMVAPIPQSPRVPRVSHTWTAQRLTGNHGFQPEKAQLIPGVGGRFAAAI